MDTPRFYVDPETVHLTHNFWLHDPQLLQRWHEYKAGQQVILFDGIEHERLYKIEEIDTKEAHVLLVTDLKRSLPEQNTYLLYPFTGSAQDESFLRLGTKQGVGHFVPVLYEHIHVQAFDYDAMRQQLITAAEEGQRSDIPTIREPRHLATALEQLTGRVPLHVSDAASWESAAFAKDYALVVIPSENLSSAEKAALDKVY